MEICEAQLNNKTSYGYEEEKFRELVADTVASANRPCLLSRKVGVSFALVGEDEMQKINHTYRKKNVATDVLSFAEFEKKEEICTSEFENIFLGEVIICPEYIEKYSKKEKLYFEEEFWKAASHGVLHLLAHVHGKTMFSVQEKIAKKIAGINN